MPVYAPEIPEIKTCRDCMKVLTMKRPECVFDTELCALHVEENWSEEIIKAIDILKRNKITAEQYAKTRISCKIKKGG